METHRAAEVLPVELPARLPATVAPVDFDTFVAARGTALVRVARALLRDPQHAEDVVQDVLVKAYQHWGRIVDRENPDAYVRRMLVNEATSFWRRGVRREFTVPDARLDDEHVDLPRLLQDTRRKAHRARTRRRVALATSCAASVAAVVAVPTGLVRLQAAGGARRPASSSPTGSATMAPTTRSTTPAPRPSPGDRPENVAYPIPDGVGFTKADFPTPLLQVFDVGQYKLEPTVPGQSCQDPGTTGAAPVAGRQWNWAEEESNRPQLSVALVVTGWAAGTGHARFEDVVRDSGTCRWFAAQAPASTQGMSADDAWAGSNTTAGQSFAHALVRVGDVLVGVEVVDPRSRQSALALARRLAVLACRRVRAAHVGLPDQASEASTPASSTAYAAASASASVPSPSGPGGAFPTGVAYPVPDSVQLVAGDFPRPMAYVARGQDVAAIPPVESAQACGSAAGPLPVAGRYWDYAETAPGSLRQITATYTVTGWATGTGHARFADMLADRGVCRWYQGAPSPASTSGMAGDEVWAATTFGYEDGTNTKVPLALAAVRVGDHIVGMVVTDPAGQRAAVDLARKLATTAAARVRAADLP